MKIEKMLTNKNPFKNVKMSKYRVPPCNVNNTGYRWVCRTCEKNGNITRAYEGETSRSIRIRSMEHIAAFKNKK